MLVYVSGRGIAVPMLFDRTFTKTDLLPLVGSMGQLCGATLKELSDGPGRGVRVADVTTGGGLSYTIMLDRGMDISRAAVGAVPLAWRSPVGEVSPHAFDASGIGWLRSFPGGLLATCGLTYLGAPCDDDGQSLGLHGRVNNTPASHVSVVEAWEGDEYIIRVSGTVRESRLFGENLVMKRTITSRLGENSILIEDAVTNEGYERTPHMMLYHINLGWPIVSQDSYLEIPKTVVSPIGDVARDGMEDWWRMDAPTPGYAEKVYYHAVEAEADGFVTVKVISPALGGRQFYVRYLREDMAGLTGLTRLTQWKQMGEGAYVAGIEPCNCGVEGRAKERERGTLEFLEPGETRRYVVEIGA